MTSSNSLPPQAPSPTPASAILPANGAQTPEWPKKPRSYVLSLPTDARPHCSSAAAAEPDAGLVPGGSVPEPTPGLAMMRRHSPSKARMKASEGSRAWSYSGAWGVYLRWILSGSACIGHVSLQLLQVTKWLRRRHERVRVGREPVSRRKDNFSPTPDERLDGLGVR